MKGSSRFFKHSFIQMSELTASDFDRRISGLDTPHLHIVTQTITFGGNFSFPTKRTLSGQFDSSFVQQLSFPSMFEPSNVKYFSSSKTTQHFDVYNKLASFLLKFFAFSACFSVYLGVFLRFKTRYGHFGQLPTNSHMGNIKLTTKSSLTDSFAIIGQSFQLILSSRYPGLI